MNIEDILDYNYTFKFIPNAEARRDGGEENLHTNLM